MSTNTWIIVLSLTVVCIVGIIVFLAQFRTRRTIAMLALVIAMFATLALCALTFLGSSFQIKPLGDKKALGGFPFPVRTTWVYSRIGYEQTIGDPTRIITATQVFTDTVVRTEGNLSSLAFLQERTVSEISVPPEWWTSSVVNPGQNWYRINGNQILSVRYPNSQEGSLRYDFPLSAGKSWCPEPQPPVDPGCHSNGLRTVQSPIRYTTPAGTFGECYEITEEFNSGGVNEWFCNGIGTVARKYDHSGTRFGYEDTLILFSIPSAVAEKASAVSPTPTFALMAPDIHIRSDDGWEAWTHSTDYNVVHQEWVELLSVRSPQSEIPRVWRVSQDVRQTYYLPAVWAPGTHLILAGKAAICNSCWSWGVPPSTINAETGQVKELDAAMLLTPEAYAFSPTQPGLVAIAQGGSRYLLDGMRLALLDLTTGKRRDLTDPAMTVFEPAWSPDGKQIAYAAVRAEPHATGDGPTLDRLLNGRAVYVLDPVTGENRVLTQPGTQAMDGWPRWTQDGNHLTYARRYADHTEMRRISLDGKADELLTTKNVSPICYYAGCGWSRVLGAVSP